MTFEKNVELDSILVQAISMHGTKGAMLAGLHKGLLPEELQARLIWLTKQGEVYAYKVEEAAKVLIEEERKKAIETRAG